MAAIADRATATFQPAGGRARATASMLVVVAVVLVAAGMAIYTLGLAGRFPQALRYELGPDGLTIRTGFRPVRVGYSEIERVEVASPKGYPARVYGTAIGSLFWGRFRWSAAGPNLYLYCTRLKPLVLLHLRSGRTIGLTRRRTSGSWRRCGSGCGEGRRQAQQEEAVPAAASAAGAALGWDSPEGGDGECRDVWDCWACSGSSSGTARAGTRRSRRHWTA